MSENQFFQTENCNNWLVQLATAKEVVHNPLNEQPALQFYGQRNGVAWASWSISFIALVQIFIQTGLQQGINKQQAYCIMLFWTIAQIPLIVLVTQLHTDNIHDETKQNDANDIERFQRLNNNWFAVQQQVTMSLIMVIWIAVMYFKKHQTELIKDSYWRKDLEQKIGSENKVSMAFAAINALYQTVLFILVNVQIEADLKINAESQDFILDPQDYNKNTRNMATFIGIMNCFFILGFLALMAWQSISFFHIVNHSIQSPMARLALFTMTSLLTILFINDVFSMMLYYWGAPAFTMTKASFRQTDDFNILPVNTDASCHNYLRQTEVIQGQSVNLLTSSGRFMRIILSISEFTPLIWSSVFAIVFFSMQFAGNAATQHVDYAQNREDLVKKNNGHINNSTHMSSSGQISLDQSNLNRF